MAKTVAAFFDRFLLAEDAIDALQKAGFDRNNISIVSSDANKEHERRITGGMSEMLSGAGAGAAIGGIAGLVLGLAALSIPGVGPIVAAGPLATSLGSAGLGAAAGGLLGAFKEAEIPENDAHYYAEGVRRGGAVVLVKTDDEHASEAQRILDDAGAADIEQRGAEWQKEGWKPLAEEEELTHSSDPSIPQTALSGARMYEDGLEMNPRRSRFSDFKP